MKVLIVKTSSLGDIVQTFPIIEYLYLRYPQISIDWVVEAPFSSLVRSHPKISQVIEMDTKSWRNNPLKSWKNIKTFLCKLKETFYDVVIDLQGNTKSGIVTFFSESHQKVGFGYKSLAELPNLLFTNCRFNVSKELNIRDHYLSLVKQYFQDDQVYSLSSTQLHIDNNDQNKLKNILSNQKLKLDNMIMICPGAHWKNKQLSLEQFQLFIDGIYKIEKECSFIFIWGTEEEKFLCNVLMQPFEASSITLEKISLPLLQNLMGKMKKVVAMDSLPLHLAGTTSTKTFAIFGPSSAETYAPKSNINTYFQGSCPYGVQFEKRCSFLRKCNTGACMKGINPKELIHAYSKESSL